MEATRAKHAGRAWMRAWTRMVAHGTVATFNDEFSAPDPRSQLSGQKSENEACPKKDDFLTKPNCKLAFFAPHLGGPLLRPRIGDCLESWPRLPVKAPGIPQTSGPISQMFRIFRTPDPRSQFSGQKSENEACPKKNDFHTTPNSEIMFFAPHLEGNLF